MKNIAGQNVPVKVLQANETGVEILMGIASLEGPSIFNDSIPETIADLLAGKAAMPNIGLGDYFNLYIDAEEFVTFYKRAARTAKVSRVKDIKVDEIADTCVKVTVTW